MNYDWWLEKELKRYDDECERNELESRSLTESRLLR